MIDSMKRTFLIIVSILVLLGVAEGVHFLETKISSQESVAQEDTSEQQNYEPMRPWQEVVTSWEFLFTEEHCEIRTARVSLDDAPMEGPDLFFEYIHCPPDKEPQFVAGMGSISSLGVKFDSSEEEFTYSQKDETIANYWILEDGQDSKAFIQKLIATSPTKEEREHCIVMTIPESEGVEAWQRYPGEELYRVKPDNYLEEKVYASNLGIPTTCSPYGVWSGMNFFKRVGNVLLYVHQGQEPYGVFDSSSFRL